MYSNLFSISSIGLMIITLTVYVLRGVEILTFIPSGVIYLLFLGAIITGLTAKIAHRQRW